KCRAVSVPLTIPDCDLRRLRSECSIEDVFHLLCTRRVARRIEVDRRTGQLGLLCAKRAHHADGRRGQWRFVASMCTDRLQPSCHDDYATRPPIRTRLCTCCVEQRCDAAPCALDQGIRIMRRRTGDVDDAVPVPCSKTLRRVRIRDVCADGAGTGPRQRCAELHTQAICIADDEPGSDGCRPGRTYSAPPR